MKKYKKVWDWLSHLKSKTVVNEKGCWIWQASSGGNPPYGYVSFEKKTVKVHRLMYSLTHPNEDISATSVLHQCDESLCINPEHLKTGTHAENMRQKALRGRCRPVRGSDNPRAKLTEDQVRFIKERLSIGVTCARLANDLGVEQSAISNIKRGKSWRHIT